MSPAKSKTLLVQFSKGEVTKSINIDKENSQYQIIGGRIKSEHWITGCTVEYKLLTKDQLNTVKGPLTTSINFAGISKDWQILENSSFLNIENASGYDKLEITISCEVPIEVELFLTNKILDVAFEHLFQPFKTHLDQYNNTKILFSAPFGQGKTTFLNEYFSQYAEEYEVFHLYPVNYAIASNEDIMRYIKCELLFQLLEKNLNFEQCRESYLDSLPHFLRKNVHRLFAPLLRLLPAIGTNLFEVYADLNKLTGEYLEQHDKKQRNDREASIDFIKEFYEQEGSIYEDNLYTQIIRQLVEQISSSGKKPVLIIDDLDRMDPEHIFRILNVFSAHFDDPKLRQLGLNNKFNFEKVILVCDNNNLQAIYEHKYGPNTRYEGYISKYYSIEVFNYESKGALLDYLLEWTKSVRTDCAYIVFVYILIDLLLISEFTMRDMIKLRKYNKELRGLMNQDFRELPNVFKSNKYSNYSYFHIISSLERLFNLNKLTQKINKLIKLARPIEDQQVNLFDQFVQEYGFVAEIDPAKDGSFRSNNAIVLYKDNIRFIADIPYSRDRIAYHNLKLRDDEMVFSYKFSIVEFYEVLLRNIEQYIKLGGIKGIGR